MKQVIVIVATFLSLSNLCSQGIEFFHGNWQETIAEAAKQEKIIFVDSYTTWCGPCKNMAKNVFTQDEVGKFFNENFINVKIDMESEEGKKFDSKYPVSAYPTLFFIDAKGKIVKKIVGGQGPEGLISAGRDALKGVDKSEDYTQEYTKGNREFDFMIKYIRSLNNAGKPSMKIANDYLASSPKISENQKLQFLFEAATEADSKLFEQMILNKSKIITLVGEDKYNEKIKSACTATVAKSIEYETPELMTEALSKAEKALTKDSDKFKYTSQMYYYHSFNQKNEYLKAAENLYKKSSKDEKTLRFAAEDICKKYNKDHQAVKQASVMAADLYKLNTSYENLLLYCKTLLDINEVDKALKIAENALNTIKKSDEKSVPQYESLYNMIKSKKA